MLLQTHQAVECEPYSPIQHVPEFNQNILDQESQITQSIYSSSASLDII